MSDLHIEQAHERELEDVRGIVRGLTGQLRDSYSIQSTWTDDDTVSFSRSGLSGTLRIDEKRVVVDMKLGMMARAFKGKIKSELSRQMANHLG